MPIPDIKYLKLVPSPLDLRDIPAAKVIPAAIKIPDTFNNPYTLTQKNQGQTPECVAFATSIIKEAKEHEEGNTIVFDPDWLYKECKKIDGLPYEVGTYLRSAMLVLKNVGAMPMGGDPTDLKTIAKYRIAGFVQVDCTPDALKAAIFQFGTVLMAFHGSNGGWAYALIRAPKEGEVVWGHGVTGIGYIIELIHGQNSWGEDWGDKGKFNIPLDYMPVEAYAVVKDLPDNWQDLLPDPAKRPHYNFTKSLSQTSNNLPDTKALQDCLVWLGCMTQAEVDTGYGIYGPRTTAAVKVFQARYNIKQVGVVGPITREKLNELFNN